MARGRPEIPKYLQKKVARDLLERQKRAGVYEKGYTDLAKGAIAGSAYPVDIADMLAKPALTQPASIKAASMRPRGGGIPETVAPVQEPKLKGTYPYVARKMGLDPDSAESIAGSFFSLDPIAKAHAVAMGTKLVAGKLAGLGMGAAMFAGLKKVDDVADAAKPIFTSPGKTAASDIAKETIPANKVKSQLEGRGVNKDEFEWTGFDDWIKTKKGEVSKAEVEEFFQQNQIQVQEVLKSETGIRLEQRYSDQPEIYSVFRADDPDGEFAGEVGQIVETFDVNGAGADELVPFVYEINVPGMIHRQFPTLEEAKQYVKKESDFGSTVKFGNKDWQLPGGENYRELLLIAPPKNVPYTKENVVPLSTEEFMQLHRNAGGFSNDEAIRVYEENYYFQTPDGVKRIPKQQKQAADLLGDGFKGQIVFDNPIKVDDFLVNINATGVSEELRYGRLDSDELVVQFDNLPNQDFNLFKLNAEELGGSLRGLDEATAIEVPANKAVNQEEAFQEVLTRSPDPKPRYTGGHFEENDVVAHIRFNERVDPDGNKVLFIEEIQSDWAHKGQGEGFKTGNLPKGYSVMPLDGSDRAKFTLVKPSGVGTLLPGAQTEQEALEQALQQFGGVTPGPFVQDIHQWTNLALKRMVRWGTDNGFDSIGWVTGKQSADRYNVSKQISEVHYSGSDFTAVDHNGKAVIQQTGIRESDLAGLIGKEPAKKLMEQPKDSVYGSSQVRTLSGLDLDIGGEYHKLIYDDVLLAQGKKIGKKYGAKVEKSHVDDNMARREFKKQEDGSYTVLIGGEVQQGITLKNYDEVKKYSLATENPKVDVWTMRLTDKLKQASKDGMPYYVALPPLAIGAAAAEQRTDAQRLQSKSDAQAIMAN